MTFTHAQMEALVGGPGKGNGLAEGECDLDTVATPLEVIPPPDRLSRLMGKPKPEVTELRVLEGGLTAEVRPRHRIAAWLISQGMSQQDVAAKLGLAPATISKWYREPWFQDFLRQEQSSLFRDQTSKTIESAEFDAVHTLISIMTDPAARPSDRISCAKEILDRARGKSVQIVQSTSISTNLDDTEGVDRRLGELLRQLLPSKAG